MQARVHHGFTIIELMVVVAVIAVLATIAAPSFKDFMLVQRLKGINAQLVTDMQFARSEAVSRNTLLRVAFGSNDSMTCYTLYTVIERPTNNRGNSIRCDCLSGPGAACPAEEVDATEVRTVQVLVTQSVKVSPPGRYKEFAFDNVTGGIYSIPSDRTSSPLNSFPINTTIDPARTLSTTIGRSGRPTACASTTGLGAPQC